MSIFGTRYGSADGYRRRGLPIGRLAIAGVIAVVSMIAYFGRTAINPVTGQKQHVAMSVDQEIALGLQSAPQMAAEFGGLDPDPRRQGKVEQVGQKVVAGIPKAGQTYKFQFHLLADPKTVNAFALPGGQVFITAALFDRLQTEGQLAGVLGHEVGHVIERHGSEHMAKSELMQGLVGAVAVGTYDPNDRRGQYGAMIAAFVGQMIDLKYGRNDESEADHDGVRFMAQAGYDPRSMIRVMEVLKQSAGGGRMPEFFSTHPDPGNRAQKIEAEIKELWPNGVPAGLQP